VPHSKEQVAWVQEGSEQPPCEGLTRCTPGMPRGWICQTTALASGLSPGCAPHPQRDRKRPLFPSQASTGSWRGLPGASLPQRVPPPLPTRAPPGQGVLPARRPSAPRGGGQTPPGPAPFPPAAASQGVPQGLLFN